MTEPDRIRREIEATQHSLSTDVNALTEKVTPGRIIERRVGRMRTAMHKAKDNVMGTAAGQASTVGDKLGTAASTAAESISEAPEAVRRGTEGNPLAAGLIVFGAGWLVSSLFPASKPERRLAGQATEFAREHVQPIAQRVTEEAKESLQAPAHRAVESVKAEASDAAATVKDEAHSATDDVVGQVQEAPEHMRSSGSR